MVNLAKHPTGGPSTTFANGGTTVCSGTAAACLYGAVSASGFYQTAMTAAPPDWSISISWPKGAFSSAANSTTGCTGSPTTLGLLYPYMLATDINDNIVVLNGDASTDVCINLITVGFDGTPIGVNQFDNTGALPNWIATDDFGHAIVPVHGAGGTNSPNNGVRIYAAGSGDSTISLISTYVSNGVAAAAPENLS